MTSPSAERYRKRQHHYTPHEWIVLIAVLVDCTMAASCIDLSMPGSCMLQVKASLLGAHRTVDTNVTEEVIGPEVSKATKLLLASEFDGDVDDEDFSEKDEYVWSTLANATTLAANNSTETINLTSAPALGAAANNSSNSSNSTGNATGNASAKSNKSKESDEIMKDVEDVINSTKAVAEALADDGKAEDRLEVEAEKLGKSTQDPGEEGETTEASNTTPSPSVTSTTTTTTTTTTTPTTTEALLASTTTVVTAAGETTTTRANMSIEIRGMADEVLANVSEHVDSTAEAIEAVADEKAAEAKLQLMVDDAKAKLEKLEKALNNARGEDDSYGGTAVLLVVVAIGGIVALAWHCSRAGLPFQGGPPAGA